MEFNKLGNTDLEVSKLCLGTMTFGEQNTESEGHEQLDYALEQGINFIDTAELYSVPGRAETQGSTERIIGTWLAERKNRDQFILATKITGPSPALAHIRPDMKFNKEQIHDAIGKSLSRLQTDYVDLYQLHWPERKANFFGKLDYQHDYNDPWEDNMLEVIELLNGLIKEGKIRHWGISNETAWGAMRFSHLADKHNLTPAVSIQNPYSLLNRSYEVGLAEVSIRENMGLLAYSPLAFGLLSGKYLNGAKPEKGRLTLFSQFSRYSNEQSMSATEAYQKIAQKHGLNLVQMSLAFVTMQPFLTSNIIGATNLDQLKENIGSLQVHLTKEVLEDIQEVHKVYSNPAP